jgi:hypothetical protein
MILQVLSTTCISGGAYKDSPYLPLSPWTPWPEAQEGKEIQWIFSPYLFRADFFEIDLSRGRVIARLPD